MRPACEEHSSLIIGYYKNIRENPPWEVLLNQKDMGQNWLRGSVWKMEAPDDGLLKTWRVYNFLYTLVMTGPQVMSILIFILVLFIAHNMSKTCKLIASDLLKIISKTIVFISAEWFFTQTVFMKDKANEKILIQNKCIKGRVQRDSKIPNSRLPSQIPNFHVARLRVCASTWPIGVSLQDSTFLFSCVFHRTETVLKHGVQTDNWCLSESQEGQAN